MYPVAPQKGMVVQNAVIAYIAQNERYYLFSGDSQEWRLSSPIVSAKNDIENDAFHFVTESGSSYIVKNTRWNLTAYMASQLENWKKTSMYVNVVADDVKTVLAIVDRFSVEE